MNDSLEKSAAPKRLKLSKQHLQDLSTSELRQVAGGTSSSQGLSRTCQEVSVPPRPPRTKG